MPQTRRQLLSMGARALWAKPISPASDTGEEVWLPLHVHMADAAGMADLLWEKWLPHGVRLLIANGMGKNATLAEARRLTVFLAAAHDLGKAAPAFQSRGGGLVSGIKEQGLPIKDLASPKEVFHSVVSQAILLRRGFDNSVAIVVGGHHGKPPDTPDQTANAKTSYANHTGFKDGNWSAVQDELLRYAVELAGADAEMLKSALLEVPAQVVLSALVIMADWLSSNENYFPHVKNFTTHAGDPAKRAENAWNDLHWPASWKTPREGMDAEIFRRRFDVLEPRALQKEVLERFANIKKPGIAVIEAPMGEGKTEAALAAAEIFAVKTERCGVFFALPTQATSDGLFPRIKAWMERLDPGDGPHDLKLEHGKARFNKEYAKLPAFGDAAVSSDDSDEECDNRVAAHEWFRGRKRGMLSGFVVGTIDHLLMAGLRRKHLALRHLGLANKVVVIDECHAYDAYMSQYLFKVLRWLGAYGVPVIVLSATLPGQTRREIIREYVGRSASPENEDQPEPTWALSAHYPVITYTDGGKVFQAPDKPEKVNTLVSRRPLTVTLEKLEEEGLVDWMETLLSDGGCAGVIVNTVRRAQGLARALGERMGRNTEVRLLHSRFLACDRAEKEQELRDMLGPPADNPKRPRRMVVVGTQVMEQSLDVDFDVLFTDLCPMDLLIQRIGRLHRHNDRERPDALKSPRCFVLGFEDGEVFDGSAKVYGEWPLLAAREILRENTELNLPGDIAGWVNRAYAPDGVVPPPGQEDRFAEARRKKEKRISERKKKAEEFQIAYPHENLGDLTGWLAFNAEDGSGKRGEATVRDTDASVEVIVIERRADKKYRLLRQGENHGIVPAESLGGELASRIAECALSLPSALTVPWRKAEETIRKLEEGNMRLPRAWRESPWLKDELFLVLEGEDGKASASLAGYRLTYDRDYGLVAEPETGGKA